MLKQPLLRFPSISLPKMSLEIKMLPFPECPQLKTIQSTASTNFSCAGKRCVFIETRTYTGPWKTTRRRASRTQVSSPSGSCFSWLSSTYLSRQELNGLATLYVEVAPLLRMPLVRLSLSSSWLGVYGSLLRQHSYISTLRCDRPQKLSSSSATFCHVSTFELRSRSAF